MTFEQFRLEHGSLLALLDEAVVVSRHFFGKLYLGIALPPALAAGAMAAAQGLMMRGMVSVIPGAGVPELSGFFGGISLFFVLFLLYMILMGLSSAAIFAGAAAWLQGRPLGLPGAWSRALKPRVLWTLFLMSALGFAGLIFCILPGIYLMTVWAMTLPVLFWEDSSGLQAMGRSRKLVIYGPDKPLFSPGMGWVLLVGLTVIILNYGVSIAVQMPLMIVQQVFLLRHIMGQTATNTASNPMAVFPPWFFALQALSTMLATMAQMLVMFFSASAFNLLYLRLKGRKEGHDLQKALDRLGAPQ